MIDPSIRRRRSLWAAVLGAWGLVLLMTLSGLAATPGSPEPSTSASAVMASPSASVAPDCTASPGSTASTSAAPSSSPQPTPGASPTPATSPLVDGCLDGYATVGSVPEASAASSASPPHSPSPTPRPTHTAKPTPKPTRRPTPKPSHARRPGKVRLRTGMAYMDRLPCGEYVVGCINKADVYYPSNHGPWPVIVTIHGRPRTQRDMAEVARALAARGAVVYNVDYRGVRPAYTKGFPESITDVACAIRWARSTAHRYGGDPEDVVLVGHSQGGYVGTMVALAGDTFRADRGACRSRRPMKDSLPEGFVSVAGVSGIHTGYRIDQAFVGGTPTRIPKVWRRATVYTHVGRNRRLKVGIVFERQDPYLGVGHATRLHAALKRARYDVRLVLLDQGTTHFDILDTDLAIGRQTVSLIWRIVRKVKDS